MVSNSCCWHLCILCTVCKIRVWVCLRTACRQAVVSQIGIPSSFPDVSRWTCKFSAVQQGGGRMATGPTSGLMLTQLLALCGTHCWHHPLPHVFASRAFTVSSAPSMPHMAPQLPEGLPCPIDYEVKQAVFIKSSQDIKELPTPVTPEFAFIGQSNVGKSSIVQLLTGNPNLRTIASKRPGKVQTMNHFLINRKWTLVDCPGYEKDDLYKPEGWSEFVQEYFLSRRSLAHIFLMIDASAPLTGDDIHAALWIQESCRPWSVIFTKMDVVQTSGLPPEKNVADAVLTLQRLTATPPPFVPTSASTGQGREALLQYIASLRQSFRMPMVFK